MTESNALKFSIITVCFNSEKSILDTLKSVNKQSWKNIEHIIIDGDSSDSTLEIIKIHGERVTKLVSEKDEGIYNAMNKGLKLATGDIIGFLNSDDLFCNANIINEYATNFLNYPQFDAMYGDISYIKENLQDGIKILRNWKPGPVKENGFSRGWIPPHPSFYAKRDVFKTHGNFREDLFFASDFDLMCRFISSGVKTKYLPGLKVYMRAGGVSNKSWLNIFKGNLEIIESLKNYDIKVDLRFFIFKFFNRINQYFN
tara:strand:+ start:657 stop:1427 length:771 start_codon:yes stop_codon:yes gene_type:complete